MPNGLQAVHSIRIEIRLPSVSTSASFSSSIQAWIDDEKLADVETEGKRISIRIECTACKPFGICTWCTSGAVRNVRVRTLTEAERKAAGETKGKEKE